EPGEPLAPGLDLGAKRRRVRSGGAGGGGDEDQAHAAGRDRGGREAGLGLRRRGREAELRREQVRRARGLAAPRDDRGEREAGERPRAGGGDVTLAGGRRRELDQHAARALRVEEADHAREAWPRRLVDEREALRARRRQLRLDAGRLEADVVEPLAAPVEEPGDAALGIDRLEQLDLAPPDGQEGRAHALIAHRGLPGDAEPEHVLPEGEAVLEAAHDEAHVVDAGQHAISGARSLAVVLVVPLRPRERLAHRDRDRAGERADRLARPLAHREDTLGPLLALAVDDRLAPPVVDEEALVGAAPLEPAASLVGHQDLVHDVVTVALAVAVYDGGAGADRLPEQDRREELPLLPGVQV